MKNVSPKKTKVRRQISTSSRFLLLFRHLDTIVGSVMNISKDFKSYKSFLNDYHFLGQLQSNLQLLMNFEKIEDSQLKFYRMKGLNHWTKSLIDSITSRL